MVNLSRDSHFDDNADNIERKDAQYAGFIRRVVALTLDGLIYIIPSILITIILANIILTFVNEYDFQMYSNELIPPELTIFIDILLYATYSYITSLFYTSKWQATPGKRIMKIYVVDANLKKISRLKAFLRTLSQGFLYIIAQPLIEVFFKNEDISIYRIFTTSIYVASIWWYMLAVVLKEKTAFHDIICGTRVLKGRP